MIITVKFMPVILVSDIDTYRRPLFTIHNFGRPLFTVRTFGGPLFTVRTYGRPLYYYCIIAPEAASLQPPFDSQIPASGSGRVHWVQSTCLRLSSLPITPRFALRA